ncbi:MAG: DegT/DnrJ/EryC1/StrS family aminotransferase, partial [Candidatus Sumerlaeota bacterium]|nr:DegT/DnrJ/EryC1/StrS family aminotransferase [Candidatus Sumerlaeota bacterium]
IVPVHYAGVGCEMDSIMRLAGEHGLTVIEDNAHGLLGRYRGKLLGTFGAMATLSFHETKNVSCGEGGAILINDPELIARAEVLRQKGTNRMRFFRGQVDKYTWVDIGSSYVPSDILAAFLLAQLEAIETIQAKRANIWRRYAEGLSDWASKHGERQALIEHLKKQGILAVFHYQPLHLSEMGARFGGKQGQCPVTEDVADRILRLPFFNHLTDVDQDKVIEAVLNF